MTIVALTFVILVVVIIVLAITGHLFERVDGRRLECLHELVDATIDQAELDRLQSLCDAAKPGPWRWSTSNSWRRLSTWDGDGDVVCPTTVHHDGHPDLIASIQDQTFIAEARTAVPKLLDEVARLRVPPPDHEARAKEFVATLDDILLLDATHRPGEEVPLVVRTTVFQKRQQLVDDLRHLLREERRRGYDDARKELRDKINGVL